MPRINRCQTGGLQVTSRPVHRLAHRRASFRFIQPRWRCDGAFPGKGDKSIPVKKAYELTFIVRQDPNEDVINDAVNQVQAWVEAGELGQVTKIDRWGRRRLAYEIDKQRDGYYVQMDAEIDPSGLPELERNLKLSAQILRYLLVLSEK